MTSFIPFMETNYKKNLKTQMRKNQRLNPPQRLRNIREFKKLELQTLLFLRKQQFPKPAPRRSNFKREELSPAKNNLFF